MLEWYIENATATLQRHCSDTTATVQHLNARDTPPIPLLFGDPLTQ